PRGSSRAAKIIAAVGRLLDSRADVSIGIWSPLIRQHEFSLPSCLTKDDAHLTEFPAERDGSASADADDEKTPLGGPVPVGWLAAAFERGETEAIDLVPEQLMTTGVLLFRERMRVGIRRGDECPRDRKSTR